MNGLPTIQFNGSDGLNLPAGMLQNASSGQIIALVQVGSSPNQYNMLWEFGTYLGSSYNNNYHFDDFGTSDSSSTTASAAEIGQYFTYDTSISMDGTSIFRADGTAVWTRTGLLPVAFDPNPDIGGFSEDFVGNIAEILVYDRVLSSQEQATVYRYLAAKYGLPSIVTNLNAPAITSSSQASGEVGQTFSYQITATNGPTSYGATGLPAGLNLNSTTGLISGSPTVSSTATVNLTASNSSGTGYQTLTLAINLAAPVITSSTSATSVQVRAAVQAIRSMH